MTASDREDKEFMKNITATLVCIGRFHLFDLAREFLKRDMLENKFTIIRFRLDNS
jgi:hypothetical protein